MPSDIRSFFGGRGQVGGGNQESAASRKGSEKEKPKTRGKRKVLEDSDDDAGSQPSKKPTPKEVPARKTGKRESPHGELTTTSDYFAASGKSKPTRSTPTKSDASQSAKKSDMVKAVSTKTTPIKQDNTKSKRNTNGTMSSRKTCQPNYVDASDEDDDDDDNFNPNYEQDDNASGEDIFEARYKPGRKSGRDSYDDNDDTMPHSTKATSRTTATSSKEAVHEDDSDSDIQMQEISMKDIPEYKEPKAGKAVNGNKNPKGRKRKSAELYNDGGRNQNEDESEEQDDDPVPAPKKAKTTKAKPPGGKTSTKNTKEENSVRTEVDDILDSITTVKAPTPPPRDDATKSSWRAAAGRTEPPPPAGTAEIPTGADNCLAGLTFVFTGLLDTLPRETGQELVKRYGGKVTGAPSKKTSFVVLGTDAGPKKLETIQNFSIKTIDERGLFELIRRLPANGGDGKAASQFEAKAKKEEEKIEKAAAAMIKEEKAEAKKAASSNLSSQASVTGGIPGSAKTDSRLWTVKYAPTATSMICGNKGQVEKLQTWLRMWASNLKTKFKRPGKDGFGAFRAMCLHGPPGIGKTTAAHLAAKLEGYDIVESNASDTRSKKLVESGLKGVLDTTSLLGYFAGDGRKVEQEKKHLVLIMDEVDGMSAGDRGGVGALAATCRKTHIPIILICNDRRLPKMKPFDSVAFDLPFRRPTIDQIRQRIMTICYREKLSVPPNVINALIEGTHADIRQVINMLSTAKLDQEAMDFDRGQDMSKSWEKTIILKPWDIVSKILGGGMFAPSSNSTLNDKIELYFNDHEFSSLMLQENYLGTRPMLANSYSGKQYNFKALELAEEASASISDGDLVDRMIHGSQQQWALMPTHAVFSFVRPASFVSGSQAGVQTRFTSWLGNNSKQSKLMRYVKEIQGHMRLRSSGDRHEIRQQYLPLLWYRLVQKLQTRGKECLGEIIDLMDSYFLTKEDWDAIVELGVGSMEMADNKIDTGTKTAFTRLYNQQSHPLPYMKASQVVAPKKKDKERPDLEEALDESDSGGSSGDDEAVLDDDEPLDLKKDKYVKAPKKKRKSEVKGKGKGKGGEDSGGEKEDESDGSVKPRKGAGKGKANGGKGRSKK